MNVDVLHRDLLLALATVPVIRDGQLGRLAAARQVGSQPMPCG
jgi:hypothetical protein